MPALPTLWLVCLSFFLCTGSAAISTPENFADIPPGWIKDDTGPSRSTQLIFQIALKLQNLDKLESILANVSTPSSPSYGRYLDIDEIDSIFGSSNQSRQAVASWLTSAGVKSSLTKGNSVWIKTDIETANKLLSTTFERYTNPSKGISRIRTTHYSIPDNLTQHVDLISPTTYFGRAYATSSRTKSYVTRTTSLSKRASSTLPLNQLPASCNETIISVDSPIQNGTVGVFFPDCLKTEYNIIGYQADEKSGSNIGFTSYEGQYAGFEDLFAYEKQFGFPTQNFSVVLTQGAIDQPQPPSNDNDIEANLDVQTLIAIANPLPVTEFITAGSSPFIPDPTNPADGGGNDPDLQHYEFLLSRPNKDIPHVLTTSYGEEEQTVPLLYATRVCNMIGLMGIRGVSVLYASGDFGVGASCLASGSTTKRQFNPFFPASCPYVTSVGGTASFGPEVGWNASSGGFSNYFPRPWYQKEIVGQYVDTLHPDTKQYYGQFVDFRGRGFPDVAAHSAFPDYLIVQDGNLSISGGTSAASPVVAGVVALINDARFKAGKPALGFLNPAIYAFAHQGFTDIVGGQSIGCIGVNIQFNTPLPGGAIIPGTHWNATVGWDPITGFGVPDLKKLLSLLG